MKTTLLSLLGILSLGVSTLYAQQINEKNVMISNSMKFLDTPYVAQTLEVNDNDEELIINCDEVDCTTFVEYALAMSVSPEEDGQLSEGDFAEALQKIRYRNGVIKGYTSRLHYITEWITNNVGNGILEDITAVYSPYTQHISVSYMSNHPNLYKQLSGNAANLNEIKKIEQAISGQEVHFLPKDKVPFKGLPWIKSGDIIAITTNIPGLDVAHMGIAFYVQDKLCLLHASSTDGKVSVSKIALGQLLRNNERWTGIRVLRLKK